MPTPKRDRRGRFVKKTRARRKTTTRRRTRKAAPRRRTYRRNPRRKMPDLIGMLTEGTMTAAQVLIGKAAARTVPDMAGLPRGGNLGLATQAGIALLVGFAADQFLSRSASSAILAGGLTAPLETFLVAQDVPWIGQALSPAAAQAEIGRYPGIGRYPKPALVAGFPSSHQGIAGMGRYPAAAEGGTGHEYAYGTGIV